MLSAMHQLTPTTESNDPISPDYIYNVLREQKKFDSLHGRQEDADEFLGSLLGALHEELVESKWQ
jgi:ubiquitin C-terminal hydrolase